MKKAFLVDPGHGGIKNGIYQTSGKRSPEWPDMPQLFEGEFTRAIAKRLVDWGPLLNVFCIDIVNSEDDIPLSERTRRANAFKRDNENLDPIYISIHSNAGGGHGLEVFTTPGFTRADEVATLFLRQMYIAFPDARLRTDMSDGDPDKEENWYVLKHTAMPAILLECFFMDNHDECRDILLSEKGRDRIAIALLGAMVELDRTEG